MLKYTLKRAFSVLQSKLATATSGRDEQPAPPFEEFDPTSERTKFDGPADSEIKVDRRTASLRVLELSDGATPEQIKKAYRRLCSQFHPDRFNNDPEKLKVANDLFSRINEAYDFLQKDAKEAR